MSKRGGGGSGDVGESGENVRVPAGTALVAAQWILALANSLDMMRNATGVMKDSLDRAEAYVPPLPYFFLLLSLLNILFQMDRPCTDAGWYPTRGYTGRRRYRYYQVGTSSRS